jgi:cystathionine beta-lyase/cystathionine gamma-synthase
MEPCLSRRPSARAARPSGAAAISTTLLSFCKAGGHIRVSELNTSACLQIL